MPAKKARTATAPKASKASTRAKAARARTAAPRTAGDIGGAAVRKATGKSWTQWCAILDREGAAKRAHAEIAESLATKHRVPPWWSQMVTVQYERARGLRAKGQTPQGWQAS